MRPPAEVPRKHLVRVALALVVLALLVPAGVSAVTYEPTTLQRGTITSPASGPTYVGIQGFHFQGQGSTKKPARVVAIGPRGGLRWTYLGGKLGATWIYDVDPLPDGNLLVTSTRNLNGGNPPPPDTMVYELDTRTREPVWTQELEIVDTHDTDLISGDELLVANMRNYDAERGVSNDRIFIYNLTRDAIVWEWYFKNHYPASTAGGYSEDWSHVNDVEKISEGRYLVSPRNFDQVIVVNRSTGAIEMRLGSDGNHSILHAQHNPDYFVSEDGHPTVLVADSENDRVVEYERRCPGAPGPGLDAAEPAECHWTRTWRVGAGQLEWPRDADRLPNGNTLITDTLNHRVIEVTPTGEIVWEFYATWGPYDAERGRAGSNGPTIADLGQAGSYRLTGSAGLRPGTGAELTVAEWVDATFSETALAGPAGWVATRWGHVVPWVKPVWMTGWDFLFAGLGVLVGVVWAGGELVYHRAAVAALPRRAVGVVRRLLAAARNLSR